MKSLKIIEVFLAGTRVGKMAQTPEGLCAFEYDSDFLASGFSISPFVLPLEKKVFLAERDPFRGNFGVFDDSLPDGWGSLLLDRYLRERGQDPQALTILQRLSLIGSSGRGALEYFPDESYAELPEFSDFDKIAKECSKILQEKELSDSSLTQIYRAGGSSGGARPKVFAKIDGKEWLIKFRASSDPANVGEIEFEHSLLAKACGIAMPETRLIQKKYFAVERFDRDAHNKIHTVSACGLVNAYYRIPSLDYTDLLLITKTLTHDTSEVIQMFRRMVFNVLISNKDDHSKNFSFQYKNAQWRLAPAYDLLPSSGFNGQHTTAINGKGNPETEDILEVADRAGINKRTARRIINELREIKYSFPQGRP